PLTVSLSHCLTLSLSHSLTLSLSHCLTLSLSHSLTVSLSHCLTLSLSHFLTFSPEAHPGDEDYGPGEVSAGVQGVVGRRDKLVRSMTNVHGIWIPASLTRKAASNPESRRIS